MLLEEVSWYGSMLSSRELKLIPYKGLAFEPNERDSLTPVTSNTSFLGNTDAHSSPKRHSSAMKGAPNTSSDSSEVIESPDEFPLHRKTKRRRTSRSKYV